MWSVDSRIPEHEYQVDVQRESVTIFPFELVLWASLTPGDQLLLRADAARFPVVVDTAHSHNFSIRQTHLQSWAQLEIPSFKYLEDGVVWGSDGKRYMLPFYDGDVWLYSDDPEMGPFRVELDGGFTFYPDRQKPPGPIIPLLGARALRTAGLRLTADYRTLRFSLVESRGS